MRRRVRGERESAVELELRCELQRSDEHGPQGADGTERRAAHRAAARPPNVELGEQQKGARQDADQGPAVHGPFTWSLAVLFAVTLRTIVRSGSSIAVPVIPSPETTNDQTARDFSRSNSHAQWPVSGRYVK